MEISNEVGIELGTIIPWVMLLPKYANTNDPAIFVVNYDGDQVVALSELNGVFFSGVYEVERKPKDLQALVHELSIYKRPQPITKLYTLNYKQLLLDEKYNVEALDVPNEELLEEKGYEINLLANYMLDTRSDLFSGSLNLLNLLSTPVVVDSKKKSLVKVGAVAGVLFLVGAVLFGRSYLNKKPQDNVMAQKPEENTAVLSQNSGVGDTGAGTEVKEDSKEVPAEDLNKEDLSIMVENGADIAGVAGRTKTRLEEAGYTIYDIGNADETGNEETILKFKKDNVKYAEMLKEDMKDVYLDLVVKEDLEESAEYDVLIVVGTNIDES